MKRQPAYAPVLTELKRQEQKGATRDADISVRIYQVNPKTLSLIRVIGVSRDSMFRNKSPFNCVGQHFREFAGANCRLHFAPEFWIKQIAVLLH